MAIKHKNANKIMGKARESEGGGKAERWKDGKTETWSKAFESEFPSRSFILVVACNGEDIKVQLCKKNDRKIFTMEKLVFFVCSLDISHWQTAIPSFCSLVRCKMEYSS